MRVLWQLSHHSSSQPDGWSGAPDEARWIREDLTPRVQSRTWALGIVLVLVDGDGGSAANPSGDHIEFHEDYDAFCAPHYEANIHGEGGAFWGRAAASTTPLQDDRLGTIFWRQYLQLPGKPADRFGWKGVNVTDYYGFRLTTAKTPGFLVEHGVGAPGAPDHDWLRTNVDAIADTWALALAEFGGVKEEPVAHELVAQSADQVLKVGQTSPPLQVTYTYPEIGHPQGVAIPQRGIKVKGEKTGRHILEVRPPVDPFADETVDLDADPTYIVIDIEA